MLWGKSGEKAAASDVTTLSATTAATSSSAVPVVGDRNEWKAVAFAGDEEGVKAAKFRRLMGLKGDAKAESSVSVEKQLEGREALFSSLDRQYAVARSVTHIGRGSGLGYSFQ